MADKSSADYADIQFLKSLLIYRKVRCSLALYVMLAMALDRIKENQEELRLKPGKDCLKPIK